MQIRAVESNNSNNSYDLKAGTEQFFSFL